MAVNAGRIEAILDLKNRMSAKLRAVMKDTDTFQKKMDEMGQKATRLGGAMTAGITVPLGIIAAQSVKTFASFEKEMSGVAAVTGATGEDFGKLEGLAKKMGETTIFTASQSAEAMRAFGLAGFETDEIMSALGPTLDLAAAGSMSMGEAADVAAKVTKGYGIEAEGTAHAMDVLTKAFTTSNTNLSELAGAFKMVGPVAKTAGVSFEMTTAALQTMADSGIIGTMAGRQLRRAMLRLVNPPGEAAKALAKLGVETSTASGRMRPFDEIVSELEPHLQNTAAMAEIFGTVAMPGMIAVLEKGTGELRKMTAALEDSDGTGKRIADTMVDNLAGAFTLLKSAVEGVWLAIGKQLEPVLRVLMDVFTQVMHFVSGSLIPGLAKLNPTLKLVALALVAAVAAAGPLILAFGMLAPSLPAIVAAFGAVAGAISLPAIAIGALVAVLVVWFAKQERVRKLVLAVGKVLIGLGRIVGITVVAAFNTLVTMIEEAMDTIGLFIDAISFGYAGKALDLLTKGLDMAGDAMMNLGKKTDDMADRAEELRGAVKKLLTGDASMANLRNMWWQLTKTGAGTDELFRELAQSAVDLAAITGEDVPDGLADLIDRLGVTSDVLTNDLNPAVVESDENWRKIATTWREGTIPQALDMMTALQSLGDITKLTEAEQDALNDTLHTAMQKYDALGEAVPQDIMDTWLATLQTPDVGGPIKIYGDLIQPPKLSDMKGWFEVGGQVYADFENGFKDQIGTVSLLDAALAPPAAFPEQMYTTGKRIASSLKTGFVDVISAIPQTVLDAFTGGGGISGALKGIGSMFGSMIGSNIGSELGKNIAKSGTKMGKAFGQMLGPLLGAVGALAGPLIGAIVKMFKGQTTQERIAEAVGETWGHAISDGLTETIAETADEIGSDWGGMMMHLAEIFKEAGGVMAFGLEDAISKTRDLFSAVEMGTLTVEQAQVSFGSAFRAIADEVVASGEVANQQFLELLELQRQFGFESVEVLEFISQQSERVFTGLAAMIVPLQGETDALTARFTANADAIKANEEEVTKLTTARDELEQETDEWKEADEALNAALTEQTRLALELIGITDDQTAAAGENKAALEAFGLVAVGAFGAAVEAGLGFVEAARLSEPAISAISTAFEALGLTSDNVAFRHLTRWNELILQNEGLVNSVDAFDDVLVGLSLTGGLTGEALEAMGLLANDQFDRLIAAGFTQNEALLMMAPNIFALVDAYEALGIPIDEDTQRLLDMALANGAVRPEDQVDGWQLVTDAIVALGSTLEALILKIAGVPNAEVDVEYDDPGHSPNIPHRVRVEVEYRGERSGYEPPHGGGDQGYGDFAHGGVGSFGSGTLAMLHGREAIIPLEGGAVPVEISGDGDDAAMLAELKALREEMELLPVHLRDALITSQ